MHDHLLRVSEHLAALDALLDSALNANVAQVGMRQNEDMRKISAWVAIIAAADDDRRDLRHELRAHARAGVTLGYPFALAFMVVACLLLYRNFKRRDWL